MVYGLYSLRVDQKYPTWRYFVKWGFSNTFTRQYCSYCHDCGSHLRNHTCPHQAKGCLVIIVATSVQLVYGKPSWDRPTKPSSASRWTPAAAKAFVFEQSDPPATVKPRYIRNLIFWRKSWDYSVHFTGRPVVNPKKINTRNNM